MEAEGGIGLWGRLVGIDHVPVLRRVGGAGGRGGMLLGHALPRGGIALLEGEALGIGPVAQDHRVASLGRRAEQIGAQYQPVIHGDRHVPIDAHAVARLALRLIHPASPIARTAAYSAAAFLSALLIRGLTSLAISSIERLARSASTQSCPA